MLDQKVLLELLNYDPKTGILTWKHRPIKYHVDDAHMSAWNKRFSGREAGTLCNNGYKYISLKAIGCKRTLSHRAIMLMMGHSIDGLQVDHKNGIRTDNRYENLRLVTPAMNSRNTKNKGGASGACGVYYDERKPKPWYVKYGDNKWGGCYKTKSEAIQARLEINKKMGYSDTHGIRK